MIRDCQALFEKKRSKNQVVCKPEGFAGKPFWGAFYKKAQTSRGPGSIPGGRKIFLKKFWDT